MPCPNKWSLPICSGPFCNSSCQARSGHDQAIVLILVDDGCHLIVQRHVDRASSQLQFAQLFEQLSFERRRFRCVLAFVSPSGRQRLEVAQRLNAGPDLLQLHAVEMKVGETVAGFQQRLDQFEIRLAWSARVFFVLRCLFRSLAQLVAFVFRSFLVGGIGLSPGRLGFF